MNCLYDFFKDSIYLHYYMNEEDEQSLKKFRDDCKTNLHIFKHDKTYDRNKYKRLQVVYRYLHNKLQEYDTLKTQGKLIYAGDIQPCNALQELKTETFEW